MQSSAFPGETAAAGTEQSRTLDKAISEATLELLKQSYTSLTAHKDFGHKIILLQLRDLEGAAELVVKGFTEDVPFRKYVWSSSLSVDQLLAASGFDADLESSRGNFLEKKEARETLQIGRQ